MKPISSPLDWTSLVNKVLIIWCKEHWKNDLLTCLFSSTEKGSQLYFKSDGMQVLVFSFSCSIPIVKSQKTFLLSQKIFCERKILCTHWTLAKCYWAVFNLEICQSGSYVPHDILNLVISKVFWVKLWHWNLKKLT